mmetsp:Transcript_24196/g.24466  ORF Transcript_24196/g.24466 Transcript_24196/m.24466 type:complete len:717 (+) Transcript_24196:1-2151(+)
MMEKDKALKVLRDQITHLENEQTQITSNFRETLKSYVDQIKEIRLDYSDEDDIKQPMTEDEQFVSEGIAWLGDRLISTESNILEMELEINDMREAYQKAVAAALSRKIELEATVALLCKNNSLNEFDVKSEDLNTDVDLDVEGSDMREAYQEAVTAALVRKIELEATVAILDHSNEVDMLSSTSNNINSDTVVSAQSKTDGMELKSLHKHIDVVNVQLSKALAERDYLNTVVDALREKVAKSCREEGIVSMDNDVEELKKKIKMISSERDKFQEVFHEVHRKLESSRVLLQSTRSGVLERQSVERNMRSHSSDMASSVSTRGNQRLDVNNAIQEDGMFRFPSCTDCASLPHEHKNDSYSESSVNDFDDANRVLGDRNDEISHSVHAIISQLKPQSTILSQHEIVRADHVSIVLDFGEPPDIVNYIQEQISWLCERVVSESEFSAGLEKEIASLRRDLLRSNAEAKDSLIYELHAKISTLSEEKEAAIKSLDLANESHSIKVLVLEQRLERELQNMKRNYLAQEEENVKDKERMSDMLKNCHKRLDMVEGELLLTNQLKNAMEVDDRYWMKSVTKSNINDRNEWEKETTNLQLRIHLLETRIKNFHKDIAKKNIENAAVLEELDRVRQQNSEKNVQINHLEEELQRIRSQPDGHKVLTHSTKTVINTTIAQTSSSETDKASGNEESVTGPKWDLVKKYFKGTKRGSIKIHMQDEEKV